MEKIEICIFGTSFLIYQPRIKQQDLFKKWHHLKYQLCKEKQIPLNTYAKIPQKYIKKIKLHA